MPIFKFEVFYRFIMIGPSSDFTQPFPPLTALLRSDWITRYLSHCIPLLNSLFSISTGSSCITDTERPNTPFLIHLYCCTYTSRSQVSLRSASADCCFTHAVLFKNFCFFKTKCASAYLFL